MYRNPFGQLVMIDQAKLNQVDLSTLQQKNPITPPVTTATATPDSSIWLWVLLASGAVVAYAYGGKKGKRKR